MRRARPTWGPPLQSLPDWTILVAKPAAELRLTTTKLPLSTGIPWAYFAAIHFVETKTGRIRGNSTAGVELPMQFIPSTWAVYGDGDIYDDHDVFYAARYLVGGWGPGRHGQGVVRVQPERRVRHRDPQVRRVMLADPRAFDELRCGRCT